MVEGSAFGVWVRHLGFGFGIWGLGSAFGVWVRHLGFGFGVWVLEFSIWDWVLGFRG
jgi:hypothetical protein